jgi:chromosome segregation ATPase
MVSSDPFSLAESMRLSAEAVIERLEQTLDAVNERLSQRVEDADKQLESMASQLDAEKTSIEARLSEVDKQLGAAGKKISEVFAAFNSQVEDAVQALEALTERAREEKERLEKSLAALDERAAAFESAIQARADEAQDGGGLLVTELGRASASSRQHVDHLTDGGKALAALVNERHAELQKQMSLLSEMCADRTTQVRDTTQAGSAGVSTAVPPVGLTAGSMALHPVQNGTEDVRRLLSTVAKLQDGFLGEVQKTVETANKVLELVKRTEPALKLIRQLA